MAGLGIGLRLGQGGSGVAGLTAGAGSFATGLAAGTPIATLSRPFGADTSFAAVGSVPGQLALAGDKVVAGSAAAVARTSYAIKVRATSGDARREVAETLSFTAQGGAATLTAFLFAGALPAGATCVRTTPATWPKATQPGLFGAGVPRFDGSNGLVVEPQRQNRAVNPGFAGATAGAVGSGGALPTGQTLSTAVPAVVNGIVTDPGGNAAMDVTLSRTGGTPSAASTRLRLAGSSGQSLTGPSVATVAWIRLVSATGVTDMALRSQYNGGGIATAPFDLGNTDWQRRVLTRQDIYAGGAIGGGALVTADIQVTPASATADFSIRLLIGLHDLQELGDLRTVTITDANLFAVAPTTAVTADERPVVAVPAGSYDRLAMSDQGAWTLGLAVGAGGDPVPPAGGARTLKAAYYLPAGSTFAQRRAAIDGAQPIEWTANPGTGAGLNALGNSFSAQSNNSADGLRRAANRRFAVQFVSRPGEFAAAAGDTAAMAKQRTELSAATTRVPRATEHWWAGTLVPQSWPGVGVAYNFFHFHQMHTADDEGDTAVVFDPEWRNGQMTLVGYGGYNTAKAPPLGSGDRTMVELFRYVVPALDVPLTIVVQQKLDPAGGLYRCWINGQQVCDYAGPLGFQQSASPGGDCFWKGGLYCGDRGETHRAQWWNVELSYASLAARIAVPLELA